MEREITAQLSEHARLRCAEMGVPTKDVKRLLRNPDLVRVAHGDRWMACSDDYPEICVVYVLYGDQPVVVTVVPRTYDTYERAS